jgi:DNA mismatch repair protein MutH
MRGDCVEDTKYDKSSVDSIVAHAKKLTGKTLEEMAKLPQDITNVKNRGDLGSLIEEYFFKHKPPNNQAPDFPEAGENGLELKTTGVKKVKNEYRAKERLVLTMIDYNKIINENWDNSIFVKKCGLMLILFYLYSKDVEVHKRKFVIDPLLYKLHETDELIIRKDWEFIRNKIIEGKAHELSEGDTIYLGACRKGAGGTKEKLRAQPKSSVKAKARAFSFKPNYLNSLLSEHLLDKETTITLSGEVDFEQATLSKFKPYIGKPIIEIGKLVGYKKVSPTQKSYEAELAKRIISGGKSKAPELDKAGIIVKTVRLKNGKLKESVSFPAFKYLDIVEEEWEESDFFERIESKFLWVVLDTNVKQEFYLKKVGYWNMPYEDRLEAEKVWRETKDRVATDSSKLPKESENRVAHVRPHAKNKRDTLQTPQGTFEVKRCFWLNRAYIEGVINSL